MSRGRKSEVTKSVPEMIKKLCSDDDFDSGDIGNTYQHSFKLALCRINRHKEVKDWKRANKDGHSITSLSTGIQFFKGELPDSEVKGGQLDVRGKIGFGVFGKVFFATWMDAVVAVKKIAKQSSRSRVALYKAELNQFCDLEHANVAQTFGYWFEKDEINILMEYMEMSLYEAIHLEECIDFSEQEKLQIIRQMSAGLKYLHSHKIAHANLKSPNVLLNYVEGKTCLAKLTDYGLTTLKNDLETSQPSSVTLKAQIWRYAAPEVLSGEILKTADMMKADIWSLCLLMHEVIYDEEPYFNLDYVKLKDDVGKHGLMPSVPYSSIVTSDMENLMNEGMMLRAQERPSVDYIDSFMTQIDILFTI
ncbi:probable serine/threonine-protein kinase drkC [Dreissena polymorpha]|uniref:Protein kinase domain-containing protein n=1 Tax=Dreissena polymorpha TaxID=45954 RepID=A0A9D4KWH7_DREPO|nr:probable serine/threonine-protein kinase drkC [Dreissena polymorpha]KAH3846296.1 hypothetical protein DPMN_088596 [Dreissena polymorpha]